MQLIFVNPIGKTSDDIYEYEFFFSENAFNCKYNETWYEEFPGLQTDILPLETTYSVIKHLKTNKKLFCAQENLCIPLICAKYGCIALCFEDINGLDEYPEPYRLVLPFGLDYDEVVEQLGGLDLVFEEGDFMRKDDEPDGDTEDEPNDDGSDDNNDDDWEDVRYPLDLNF